VVDRVDAVSADDGFNDVPLGHVAEFERTRFAELCVGELLDVGGEDVRCAVFFAEELEELRADLAGRSGDHDPFRRLRHESALFPDDIVELQVMKFSL